MLLQELKNDLFEVILKVYGAENIRTNYDHVTLMTTLEIYTVGVVELYRIIHDTYSFSYANALFKMFLDADLRNHPFQAENIDKDKRLFRFAFDSLEWNNAIDGIWADVMTEDRESLEKDDY